MRHCVCQSRFHEVTCLRKQLPRSAVRGAAAASYPFPNNLGTHHCIGGTDLHASRKERGSTVGPRQLSERRGESIIWKFWPFVNSLEKILATTVTVAPGSITLKWRAPGLYLKNKERWKHLDPTLKAAEKFYEHHTFRSSYQPWKTNWSSKM